MLHNFKCIFLKMSCWLGCPFGLLAELAVSLAFRMTPTLGEILAALCNVNQCGLDDLPLVSLLQLHQFFRLILWFIWCC